MITWTNDLPQNITLDQILYQCRRSDGDNTLLLDSVTMADILEDIDEILVFDALVSSYAKLERKMNALQAVMNRAGGEVKPVAMQISDPFRAQGVAQVAAVFELSDGQTVTIYFHNPDVDPRKIAPGDELISWKWLLNRRDLTLLVAPERVRDLNVSTVASRVMQLAEKNSQAFQRANAKRAENMAAIQTIKGEIVVLEKELADVQHELEAVKIEHEYRSLNPPSQEQDNFNHRLGEIQNRFIAVRKAFMARGWLMGIDGVSLIDSASNHIVIYQPKDNSLLQDGTWMLYHLGDRMALKPVREFIDKYVDTYAETPQQFTFRIDKVAV